MVRIAVDAMGSDRGPEEIVAGALEARTEGIEPILFGDPSMDPRGLELHVTSDVNPASGVIVGVICTTRKYVARVPDCAVKRCDQDTAPLT